MEKINAPTAIIVAGALIAIAIIFTGDSRGGGNQQAAAGHGQHMEQEAPAPALPPLTEDDHIIGSPDAPIIFVEYSDLECPFCKRYHETLNRVMEEYGEDGTVAWVYRHFPLDSIHPKARTEAEATECAAELGGNEGFWNYTNRLFEVSPTNNGLDLALLPQIAVEVGLDEADFTACLESGRHAQTVEDHLQGGIAAGVRSTPSSFILLQDGTAAPLPAGAQPFATIQGIVEEVLANTETTEEN